MRGNEGFRIHAIHVTLVQIRRANSRAKRIAEELEVSKHELEFVEMRCANF